MNAKIGIAAGLVCLVLIGVLLLPALCQQAGGPPIGPGGPMMGGPMGPPPGPPMQMVAADGALYVACDGKVIALEAKTLKKLAEVTVSERPRLGPGGPPPNPGLPPGAE